MSVTPKDILRNKDNLNKRIEVKDIDVSNVSIDDLKYDGNNYSNHINLLSLLENLSSCQISDAYNGFSKRSGAVKNLKSVNNLKVWGRIFPCETNSDDWGTSAMAIDAADEDDILFIKVNNDDAAIWGELASKCAQNNGIKATAIYGCVRDLDALLYMDYPIFATGFCPNAGSALGLGNLNIPVNIGEIDIKPGDFFFGDESGVVVIPQSLFTRTMINSLAVKINESNIVDDIGKGKTLSQIVGLD